MGWKDWSYWLKGGIIGLIIGVIALILPLFYLSDCAMPGICVSNDLMKAIHYIGFWLFIFVDGVLYLPWLDVALMVLVPIVYIFYGIVLGWIYGKIKNKAK